MSINGGPGFEIPQEMRVFAEKSVEQAWQAFDSFVSAARKAVETAESQFATAHSGATDVRDVAIRYAEQNVASSFEFAHKLLRAKDMPEVLALHSDYVTKQMDALATQAKDLGQRAAKMGPGAGH